ncbi:MAG: PAS domain-containing protein [Fimbriimonadaceae bacterium]
MGQDSNLNLGRKLDIVLLAADGMTDKQIAASLGISTNTVESHWKRLRTAYRTSSRVKIVASVLRELSVSQSDGSGDGMVKISSRGSTHDSPIGNGRFEEETIGLAMRRTHTVAYLRRLEAPFDCLFVSDGVRYWGYEPADLMPPGMRFVDIVHPEDAAIFFPNLFKADLSSDRLLHMLYRARHKSGTYRWCHDRVTVVSDRKLGASCFIGVATDIDDLVAAGVVQVPADRRIWVVDSTQS